jgi:hypothetical protein
MKKLFVILAIVFMASVAWSATAYWDAPDGVFDGYKIYFENGEVLESLPVPSNATEFVIPMLIGGVTYNIWMTSTSGDLESNKSNIVVFETKPGAPQNLRVVFE